MTIGIAATVLVALLAWFLLGEANRSTRPEAAPPGDGVPVAAPAPEAGPPIVPKAIVSSKRSRDEDEVQMCDGSWVRVGADGRVADADAEHLRRRALERVEAPTLAAMEAGSDERAQAAAHFFQSAVDLSPQPCDGDDACVRSAEVRRRQVAHTHLAALVRLAQTSIVPQVYAWAVQACARAASNAGSPCQLINAEQWARLDPTNAAPWLVIAGEAETHRDAGALDDAMFHVASARRHDTGWGALPATLAEHVPPGAASLFGALALEREATGIDNAPPMPFQTATRYCDASNVADANRREICDRVADLLVDRSSTLQALGIGAGMGKRLGWPEERIRSIDDEKFALYGALSGAVPAIEGDQNCKAMQREVDRVRDIGRLGEVGSLRRAIVASGKTIPRLAADYRQSITGLREQAPREEAAASAASAVAEATGR